ncbi:MATE family efflux transporter [Paenibacillus sp. MMS20-IR301]|uniref:MATE family efflux transporter n=1 Tax=Paenibacillus sp. MMS20-IR301 TaxID=2895946 RepID=UPI0028E7DB8B|nr:MATE family efflux transporter [Paenibacillus sp. MMS20-IR301]WNS41299.1 MATE family efflux transporter [Paenibacillus sp. MMS20-IR301]
MNRTDKTFNRTFNRELVNLVIPIALQNLIAAAAVSADVVMLGAVGQSAMSAVSLAGQITFVLTLFYMGMSAGAGILAAQYWGKKDMQTIQRVLNIACAFAVVISLIFFVISLKFPNELMQFFTQDDELISYGASFLHAISFSYLAMGFAQMYLGVIRSMEKARLSALISSSGLLLNILLNALSIFVFFPDMPEKAITAVALSTVAARFFELGWCYIYSVTRGTVRFQLPKHDEAQRKLLKDYLRYTTPVQGNYIVWGGALTATAAIIGHVNADMVAANSVASVVKNLAVVLSGGIAAGGSVLVGKYLGNNDIDMAKKAGSRMIWYALIFGVLSGGLILLMKPLVFLAVDLSPNAQEYLHGMLYICAYYCIAKSMNATTIAGLFVAGGDSKFGFWCDTIVMWGVILPLSYISAFVWHFPPIAIYIVISLDEVVKMPAALMRYRQLKWLKNLTRNFTAAQVNDTK